MDPSIKREVGRLSSLEIGSDHFDRLVRAGCDRADLEAFVREGRAPKAPGCGPVGREEFTRDLELLFDLGGWVAGGGALARVFGTHRAPDYDVFFDDPDRYAMAVLAARRNPLLDVCFFAGRPYDSFDLAVCKCCFTRDELDVHPSCLDAVEHGVSDICPGQIVNAAATARRIVKYNARMGVRFRTEQVLAMCGALRVDAELAAAALRACVGP